MKLFLALLLFLSAPVWALFTGNNQYNRADLNTEAELDSEYFLDLLSYRPFWRPPPAAQEPRAYARASDGSLNNDQLYILQQVRVRGMMTERSFWGYQLQQESDLEQDYFYQFFEVQAPVWGPLAFRIFGQPTHDKQDADLGFGGVWEFTRGLFSVEGTFVDFLFNEKNLNDQHDLKQIYYLETKLQSQWGEDTSGEIVWGLDSPVEREFLSEGNLFDHHANQVLARMKNRVFELDLLYRRDHRLTATLPTESLLQDFRKSVYAADGAWLFKFRESDGKLGMQVQWRDAAFVDGVTSSNSSVRRRWVVDPYIGAETPLTKKLVFETAFFPGMIWETLEFPTGGEDRDFFFQAKLMTALRIDFTPHVGLLLNPTWDLDEIGSGRTFDGGNIQLRAEIP